MKELVQTSAKAATEHNTDANTPNSNSLVIFSVGHREEVSFLQPHSSSEQFE